ncbi:MAG: hypothetical protein ACREUT_15530 [Steroidobacteraceae bacterium]
MSPQLPECRPESQTAGGQAPDLRLVELVGLARARFNAKVVWYANTEAQAGEHPLRTHRRGGGWDEIYQTGMWGFGRIKGVDVEAPKAGSGLKIERSVAKGTTA